MSDLPKITEYFVDKLNGKKTPKKQHSKSNLSMMYPSLNTVKNITEPVLRIRRPSSNSICFVISFSNDQQTSNVKADSCIKFSHFEKPS